MGYGWEEMGLLGGEWGQRDSRALISSGKPFLWADTGGRAFLPSVPSWTKNVHRFKKAGRAPNMKLLDWNHTCLRGAADRVPGK